MSLSTTVLDLLRGVGEESPIPYKVVVNLPEEDRMVVRFPSAAALEDAVEALQFDYSLNWEILENNHLDLWVE